MKQSSEAYVPVPTVAKPQLVAGEETLDCWLVDVLARHGVQLVRVVAARLRDGEIDARHADRGRPSGRRRATGVAGHGADRGGGLATRDVRGDGRRARRRGRGPGAVLPHQRGGRAVRDHGVGHDGLVLARTRVDVRVEVPLQPEQLRTRSALGHGVGGDGSRRAGVRGVGAGREVLRAQDIVLEVGRNDLGVGCVGDPRRGLGLEREDREEGQGERTDDDRDDQGGDEQLDERETAFALPRRDQRPRRAAPSRRAVPPGRRSSCRHRTAGTARERHEGHLEHSVGNTYERQTIGGRLAHRAWSLDQSKSLTINQRGSRLGLQSEHTSVLVDSGHLCYSPHRIVSVGRRQPRGEDWS